MRRQNVTLPVSLKPMRWAAPDGSAKGHFKPNGRPVVPASSRLLTPNWSSTEPTWAARLFVGFNVGTTPTYEMEDIIKIVRRVRREQGAPEDSSYVYQRGVYTHQSHDGEVVTENGAQIVLLNLDPSVTEKAFRRQMIELANVIVREMQQETVIIEMQQGGIVREVIGVSEMDTELDVES